MERVPCMLRFISIFSVFLCLSCSTSSFRISPEKISSPHVLSRGWSYVESSDSLAQISAGSPMVYYSHVEVMDNLLIYTSERFGISVLNKYTGALLWRKKIAEGSRSGIYTREGVIYVGGNDGFFRAYHKNGKEIWKTDLRYPIRGKPLIVKDRIFVSTINHSVHALQTQTGSLLWTYPHPVEAGMHIRGGGNISYLYNRLWVGFDDGVLLALRPRDAVPLFRHRFPRRSETKFFDVDAPVFSWKKGLLVSSFNGKLYHMSLNGKIFWSFPAGSVHAPALRPSKENPLIYIASNDGSVYAVDGKKGMRRWKYTLPSGVPTGVAYLRTKNVLVVSSSNSYVYALHGDTGQLLDAEFLGSSSGSYGPLAVDVDESSLYLVSMYGRVYQFRVRAITSSSKNVRDDAAIYHLQQNPLAEF